MTFIEIMVAVAILAFMAGVVGMFQRNIFYYKNVISGSLTTVQDARTILHTMVAELRSASPSSNGAYPIITAGTSTLTFFSDVNADGIKDQIRYFLNGTQLYRGIVTPTGSPLVYNPANERISLLASNIRNGGTTNVFDYFDGTYYGSSTAGVLTQPVTVTAVRLVKITLTLDVDQNNLPVSRVYTTQVTLRNIKDNL